MTFQCLIIGPPKEDIQHLKEHVDAEPWMGGGDWYVFRWGFHSRPHVGEVIIVGDRRFGIVEIWHGWRGEGSLTVLLRRA